MVTGNGDVMSNPNDLELLAEFNRLVAEGGIDLSNQIRADYQYYNCATGNHKWRWYVGAHMDKYWFCELCDLKDYAKKSP